MRDENEENKEIRLIECHHGVLKLSILNKFVSNPH